MTEGKSTTRILPNRDMEYTNVGLTERLISLAGGTALAYVGLKKGSTDGVLLALGGGALLFRGLTGFCPVNAAVGRDSTRPGSAHRGIEIRTSLTVNRSRGEVYAFWRRLENLPSFMQHLSEVRQVSARRSQWTAPIPKTGGQIEWDAVLEAEDTNRLLAWRSVEGADVDNAGEVHFVDAPGGRGTEVHVHLSYRPPAGAAGKAAAKLLNPVFEQMVHEDLRRFKHVMEAREAPTVEGQPTGE